MKIEDMDILLAVAHGEKAGSGQPDPVFEVFHKGPGFSHAPMNAWISSARIKYGCVAVFESMEGVKSTVLDKSAPIGLKMALIRFLKYFSFYGSGARKG